MAKTTDELADRYADSQQQGTGGDPRPVDMRADRAWGAVESALHHHTLLPADEYRHVGRAAKIYEELFPDGLKFTQLEYGAQWSESEWRVQHIAREGLEPDLRKLCGDVFIQELLKSHRAYGQMTGTTRARPAAPAPANLAELRRSAQQATVAYAVQLVALHLEGDADERAAVEAALRPFDAYRERVLSDLADSRAKTPPAPPPPAPPPPSSPVVSPV